MTQLTDRDRLFAFQDALSNWSFGGYVQFELHEQAYQWIRRELDAISLRELSRLMHAFVAAGGIIDEVPGVRSEWRDEYEFHHDLRFEVQGKAVYVETRLHYRILVQPDESWILVVNVHAP